MGTSREEAKGAIVSRDDDGENLSQTLADASNFRLDLLRENNRHAESMRGHLAKLFGQDNNVPVFVAATGMLLGLIGAAALWGIAAQKVPDQAGVWMQQAERLLAFSATCLAFIFGKGLSKE